MYYQKITVQIKDQNVASPFSTNTDRNYKYVKKISVYTSPSLSDNRGTLKMSKDFKIGGELMYPSEFDLFPLHPALVATERDYKYKYAKAEGSTIEGEIMDTGVVLQPYYVTILLCLDNEPEKEDVSHKLNMVLEELGKISRK